MQQEEHQGEHTKEDGLDSRKRLPYQERLQQERMTTKRAEVLLGRWNYFHWEYNMSMALARKGLLAHVQVVKPENEMTDAWLVNDANALGIIAHGVENQHQTKIRSATRAMQTWNTLREYKQSYHTA
ncbi:unnamed protein product [Phytophthora fragariaefolia]|uniref:Unnamed protein product n=1 Tax=Phytophthora fragariaefolia TaxID=1490495 RepID=A0A9W6TUS5_9STRA|nr:unnamed protein product [Phytophthora fragariaefolia]